MVVLGDVATPRERGKYYGYFAITYTTAGACGPALGGCLADYLHWSVIFWMNIPLGLARHGADLDPAARLPRHERPHKLDFLGAALIMASSSSFMLALNMGGVSFPWGSTPILACSPSRCCSAGLHRAASHRAGAAHPAVDPERPAGAARHRGQRIRLGADRRPQHLPADLPAEHHRSRARRRGPERAGARDDDQHQRRHHGDDPADARALQTIPICGWRWRSSRRW